MSSRKKGGGGSGAFQPGGREYEKRKAANKRRGPANRLRKPQDEPENAEKRASESDSEEEVEGEEKEEKEKILRAG